jgi:hypothetical protein
MKHMEQKIEMGSHNAFGEAASHNLEDVLLLVGHVAPVAMFLPLRANPAVLVQILHPLRIHSESRKKSGADHNETRQVYNEKGELRDFQIPCPWSK